MKNKINFKSLLSKIIILCGLIILIYPLVSNLWNEHVNKSIIDQYNLEMKNIDLSNEVNQVEEYNKTLFSKHDYPILDNNVDKLKYEDLLSNKSNAMCYIDIPRINLKLPVFHYSKEDQLNKGIGHIENSSLPYGGLNTHCLLTGHRGIPGKRLFTDLDDLEIGDVFYIHILNEIHSYKIVSIRTVLPEEISRLKIEENEDLVTLITCTPYAVNTHRLLITGSRVNDIYRNDNNIFKKAKYYFDDRQLVVILGLFVIFIVFLIYKKFKRR